MPLDTKGSLTLPSLESREDYSYFNEESLKILSRGYIAEGTPREYWKSAAIARVNFLIDRAEEILCRKLPTMRLGVQRGWISPSSPVWSNFGTDRGLPISCVTGDAWINTRQGAKLAKDVEIGDELLTHKNRFRRVTAVIPTENRGDIYSLKVVGRLTRSCFTGNHEILTNEGWLRVDQLDPAKHLVAINNGAEWVEAGHTIDMTRFVPYDHAVEDGRIIKKLTAKNQRRTGRENVAYFAEPNASVEVTSDLAWAFGLWFADGSITRSNTGPNGIRITLSIKEEEIGKRWLEIITNAFGVNGAISYGGRKTERTWLNVNVNSVVLGRFFQSFGNGCKEKQMPQWLLELPRGYLAEVLDGVIEGDGSRRKLSDTWKITLANPHLIMQVYLLALRCGVNVSLQMQDKPSHWGKTKFVYTIVSMKDRGREMARFAPNAGVLFHDGLVYAPIRELVKTDRVETVYDFTVDEDHSFSVAGMVVHNCNGSRMADSVDSIAYKVAEISMMTKEGAGTSLYMGDLRASGEPISGGGKSEGPVHFARLVQEAVTVISQGNTRRGNAAVYLDIDHPDIDEWLLMRSIVDGVHHPIQHLSFGVVVSDAWMSAMLSEEKGGPKRKLLTKIVNKRRETGYPYLFFKDSANKARHFRLKELGLEIVASNLCMTGDQRVVSSLGLLTAKELFDMGVDLTLFDGSKPVSSSPMKLREESAAIYRVTLANGMEHKITDYHKLPVRRAGQQGYEMVKCADLRLGDRVEIQTEKGLFGLVSREDEALMLGLYQGDGTTSGDNVLIDIWENDFDLEPEIVATMNRLYAKYPVVNENGRTYATPRFGDCQVRDGSHAKRRLTSQMLKKQLGFEKASVPRWIWEADEATVWAYVRGLLLTDGTATVTSGAGNPTSVSFASVHHEWIKDLQLLFRNLGLSASIYKLRDGGEHLLPNGKGGQDFYKTRTCWRLVVGNKNDALEIERHTGFLSRKGVKIEDRVYRDNSRKVSEVVSVEFVGYEAVYCPTVESEEHIFVAQGMRTSNCTEIALPSTSDESFVCNLSSLNLLYFDEWKSTPLVWEVVMFLDAVMSEYIEKCKQLGRRLLADALRFAERWRALGIGTLGYHSYLQQNMIPFRSDEARAFNIEAHQHIYEESRAASRWMAQEYGEPEGMKGTGYRHLTLQAIAPTRSSSLILGQVSQGIEPLEANIYEDDNAKSTFIRKSPAFETLLMLKGKNTDEVWLSVMQNAGSVQHLDFLTDHEKAVFETFLEIGPAEIIHQNNDRTPFVDQGISLNIKVDPDASLKDNVGYIIQAWKGGSKSLYYHLGLNKAQELVRKQTQCLACEA